MYFKYSLKFLILQVIDALKMRRADLIKSRQKALNKRYKELVEQAYNLRQTDSALSDFSEFNALKLLDQINKLKYLSREITNPTS
ncbi:Lacal_2735 family protein [Seonamhaeicola marinus]|nr:Lacal_2735 family protein [Seonamhaeicola marinus]